MHDGIFEDLRKSAFESGVSTTSLENGDNEDGSGSRSEKVALDTANSEGHKVVTSTSSKTTVLKREGRPHASLPREGFSSHRTERHWRLRYGWHFHSEGEGRLLRHSKGRRAHVWSGRESSQVHGGRAESLRQGLDNIVHRR